MSDEQESLCDYCKNQPECNDNHQMCVSFEPKADPPEAGDKPSE